jgi:hypothetical protein
MKFELFFRRTTIIFLLIISISIGLFFPQNAQAQFVVTDPPNLLQNSAKWIWERVEKISEKVWKAGGAIAYRNGINFFLGQVAQQSAEYIATGGKGQKPMFLRDPNYWNKLGDQVLGEWIDQTAKSVTGFTGRSLCDPIDPTIKFNMLVGFDPKYQEMMFDPDMRCSWSTIKSRYKELSKKKLFDFDVKLKEGEASRYKGNLIQQISSQPDFSIEIKTKMISYLNEVGKTEKDVAKTVQSIKEEYESGAGGGFEEAKNQRKIFLETALQSLKNKEKQFKNDVLIARECLSFLKNEQNKNFCDKKNCFILCAPDERKSLENNPEENCNSAVQKCFSNAQLAVTRFNQTLEQGRSLIDETDKMIPAIVDLSKQKESLSMEDLNKSFNPEASDVAVMFQVQSRLFAKQAEAIQNSKFMQSLTGDINRLSSHISDLTLTPSSFVDEQARGAVKSGTAGPLEYTGVAVADAIGVFTNTLINKLLKQFFEKGLNPEVSPEIAERTAPFLSNADEFNSPGKEESKILYADLATASVKRGREITIYDEFAVCPEDTKYALPTNCLLDNKLIRAMEEKLTIREAIEKNLLDGNQLVGSPNSNLNLDNVKKLRRYRIFPLGLEIAATIISKKTDTTIDEEITLKELLNEFNRSGKDGICGTDDDESKFCHLVDPNWVLKPLTYKCEAQGYSAIPLFGSPYRQETCVDLKDCIHENEEGECDTWAYCTREKNIWRFNGDECDSQYASCQTYNRAKDKQKFSYLTNALDFANCNQNNAGCLWYCSHWDESLTEKGGWACESPGVSKKLSRQETCKLSNACSQVDGCLCVQEGSMGSMGSCLVLKDKKACVFPVYVSDSLSTEAKNNSKFFNNKVTACSAQDEGCREYIRTAPGLGTNLIFNGSFEIDANADGIPDGWSDPRWEGTETISSDEYFSGSFSYKFEHSKGDKTRDWTGRWQLVPVVPGGEYTISLRVKVPAPIIKFTVNYYFDDDGSGYIEGMTGKDKIIFDGSNIDWQIHEETITVPLNINYVWLGPILYGDGVVYIDDFKFEAGNKFSSYQSYGAANKIYLKNPSVCRAEEVGCELYTPTKGGQSLPGIIREKDKCSYQCLGYNTFQEMPTVFAATSRWVNFIPSTAKACSTPGCEEFTNLETEKREYYSYLRQCVKINEQEQAIADRFGNALNNPNSNLCQYYYTWVGSENTGYQLKKYFLEKDSVNDGPAEISANPDLTWGECENENDVTNPHCKQFYDSDGKVYYRLYKNTITCSPDCVPYRRSADQSIKTILAAESETCSERDNNCREYKGSFGDNVRNVFVDDFESGEKNSRWGTESYLSPESVNYPGYSLAIDGEIDLSVSDLVWNGKTYFISFWMRTEEDKVVVKFSSLPKREKTNLIKDEWQEVKFGPFYFDKEPSETEILSIETSEDDLLFIDNFAITEVQDNLYLIKDSWFTPCACDTLTNHDAFATNAQNCTLENTASASAVGCQVYQNRAKQVNYLKSFTRLCSTKAIGCEALIDTQNSDSPLQESFNVGADKLFYLVNDKNNKCDSKYQGCEKFGRPNLDINGKVLSYTDVYLVNDPDLYNNLPILCKEEDVGCEEYQGPFYFKDPGEKVCEYRENVPVGGENKTGWFKKDSNNACYYNSDGSPYQPDGVTYGIRFSYERDYYNGWAGVCPTNQSSCTEFIDPLAVNLIGNSSFEQTDYVFGEKDCWSTTDLYKWDLYSDQGDPVQVVESPFIGSKGLQIKDSSGSGSSMATIIIEARGDETYSLSAAAKVLSGKQSLYLDFLNKDKGRVKVYTELFSGNDWEKKTITEISPSETVYIRVILYSDSPVISEAYWDDIKLVNEDSSQAIYYYLNNNKLDKSSCQNMVGLKDGCVLFNDTSKSRDSLIYDAASTYANSQNNNDLAVAPVITKAGEGDANIILKVKRDRVCGEWLECIGSREEWSSTMGEKVEVCDFIGRCDKLTGKGEDHACGHYVFYSNPEKLTKEVYKERNISWSGMDYSGHSLLDMYPMESLSPVEMENNGAVEVVLPLDYKVKEITNGPYLSKVCKIFPEKDSPFIRTSDEDPPNNEYYSDINVCYSSDDPKCQCLYKKVEYGGVIRYYNEEDEENIPDGVLIRGGSLGENCSSNDDPNCSLKTKEQLFLGVRGFCLEKDKSKPEDINACLTWWIGSGIGDYDIFQNHPEAAFKIDNNYYYCLNELPVYRYYIGSGYKCYNNTEDCIHKVFYSPENPPDPNYPFVFDSEKYDPVSLSKPLPDVKLKEVEKIEVYLGADTNDNGCKLKSMEDEGWLTLQESSGWIAHQVAEWNDSKYPLSFDCSCPTEGSGYNKDTIAKVKACFGDDCTNQDKESKLKYFLFIGNDHTPSGGAVMFGAGSKSASIIIYLKPRCEYLAEVPKGNLGIVKGAYTDRLLNEKSTWYKENNGSWIKYPYGRVDTTDPTDTRTVITSNNNAIPPFTHTKDSLKNLFAYAGRKLYMFNIGSKKYDIPIEQKEDPVSISVSSDGAGRNPLIYNWDDTIITGNMGPGDFPKVASVKIDTCEETTKCEKGNEKKITINGRDSGDIIRSKSFLANLSFFAWVDKDHMPIKEIVVDWGLPNGVATRKILVLSKNHRPKDECDNSEWGRTNESCVEEYFRFMYVYNCEGKNSPGWDPDQQACVFTPKVYIKDNWDWCTNGYYAGDSSCDTIPKAAVSYGGKIIVKP